MVRYVILSPAPGHPWISPNVIVRSDMFASDPGAPWVLYTGINQIDAGNPGGCNPDQFCNALEVLGWEQQWMDAFENIPDATDRKRAKNWWNRNPYLQMDNVYFTMLADAVGLSANDRDNIFLTSRLFQP